MGVENKFLFICSVRGIFPGVSTGDDSCSFLLVRGVNSELFCAKFLMGVANAPIPGWDFLLPRLIFSGISISAFPGTMPLLSDSNFCFNCLQ